MEQIHGYGHRRCKNCGVEQVKESQIIWGRITSYKWFPLVGRCTGGYSAEHWYNLSLTNYINQYKLTNEMCWFELPPNRYRAIALIKSMMKTHTMVKAGYTATAIRGYHDYLVICKEKQETSL